MRVTWRKCEAAFNERGAITLTSGVKLFDNGIEIGGGRAVADADDGEDLTIRLKIFPGAGWGPAEDELEPERTGVPGLVRERRFLVLRVERADGGEGDRVVAE